MPVPAWDKVPVLLTRLATVMLLVRSKVKVALSTTLPVPRVPVVPAFPIWSVPALIVVPPRLVLAPVRIVLPEPDWVRAAGAADGVGNGGGAGEIKGQRCVIGDVPRPQRRWLPHCRSGVCRR